MVVALGCTVLVAEVAVALLVGGSEMTRNVSAIGAFLVLGGYVVVLGDFSASLPGGQEVVAAWRLALRWIQAMAAGLVCAAVFGGLALLFHQTQGPNVWIVGLGIGLIGFTISMVGALLLTARGHSLLRSGFEAPRI